MHNGAYVEIWGILDKSIEIRECKSGRKYGVIKVAVSQSIDDDSPSAVGKTYCFTLFIWNQKVLDIYAPHLKKGRNILAVGELELIEQGSNRKKVPTTKNNSRLKPNIASIIIINIKQDSGITLLEKHPELPRL